MKIGPDISYVAALIGDPARTNMLLALMNGEAWTAGDLSREAGVTPATTSSHLSKLLRGGLVQQSRQGRYRFYSLANDDVGEALEVLLRIAARTGHTRHIVAPSEAPLRSARVCYAHLAGEYGVRLFEFMRASHYIVGHKKRLRLSTEGKGVIENFGIRVDDITSNRRPLCRVCLDWSERTHHLGGLLGAAMLERMTELKWLDKEMDSRVVSFTSKGRKEFAKFIST